MRLENETPSSNVHTIIYEACPKGDLPVPYHQPPTINTLYVACLILGPLLTVIVINLLFRLGGYRGH